MLYDEKKAQVTLAYYPTISLPIMSLVCDVCTSIDVREH